MTNPAVVFIKSHIPGRTSACTGTFIGPQLILTARHCVEGGWDIAVWDGDTYSVDGNGDVSGSGNSYNVGTQWHLPTSWSGYGPQLPDLALLETAQTFAGTPVPIAAGSELPQPGNIGAFANAKATAVGFSDNGSGNRHRLQGTVRLNNTDSIYQLENGASVRGFGFQADPNEVWEGDSGGPLLLNGKLIGVLSAKNGSTDYAAYVVPDLLTSIDSDRDGIPTSTDNCPDTPNADQANCNYADEITKVGDACDPTPCVYLGGALSSTNQQFGPLAYFRNTQVNVQYRGVGYLSGQSCGADCRQQDLDARVCACHDADSPDPHNPTMYHDTCATRCRPGTAGSRQRGTGYLRLNWQEAYPDTVVPSFSNPQSCPLVDDDPSDGVTIVNDCTSPVPNRLFVKPYAGTSLGGQAADWEDFWTSGYRTRSFKWDWRNQDYPHALGYAYHPPINGALVRLWAFPAGYGNADNPNNATPPLELALQLRLIEPLLLTLLESETSILPDPIDARVRSFGLPDPPDHIYFKPLSVERHEPEVDRYAWSQLPTDALTKGLVIARMNPDSGELSAPVRSIVALGDPPYTAEFESARWTGWPPDSLFIYGGRSRTGARPAKLWFGVPTQLPGGEVVAAWYEIATSATPPGRTGSIFVADAPRNRLVILGGRTASGVTQEGFILDLTSFTWSSVDVSRTGLPAVEGAGYSYDGSRLYVYGGRNASGAPLAGLYEIDLSSLTGYRVDSGSGPGARADAALRYDPVSRTVFLFGGADTAAKRDLWRFHLGARSWQRVSTEGALAMVRGAVVPGRRDGAVNVLAGKMAGGSTLPLWRYRAGAWKNYYQVMNP